MRKAFPLHGADHLSSCQSIAPIHNALAHAPVMSICEEMACSLDVDLSSLPSDIRGTARHLTSRHLELGKWQSLTELSLSRVGREIDALQQLKIDVERQLEERKTYARFIGDCVKFKEDFEQFIQDEVYAELKKELQLTHEVNSTLQNHIFLLQSQIDALKDVYAQLKIDYQDKSEAIRLMTKCITYSNFHQCQQDGPKRWHITYDNWESECNNLQNKSESLSKKATNLRGNIQFTLTNLKNACEGQRSNTSKAMRKAIHIQKKTEEQMRWKLKQALNDRDDLTKASLKVAGQMRNCEARTTQNTSNLCALNQRQRNELCLDQAHNSLALQQCDLALIASGLERMWRRVQSNMDGVKRRIPILERELQAQERALQTEVKCQDMYHNILPLHKASVERKNNAAGAANFLERL